MNYKIENKKFFFVSNVVIPIFIGGAIYYLFCPDVDFVKRIDVLAGGGIHFLLVGRGIILLIIRNYIFDALWAYSLMNCFLLILEGTRNGRGIAIICATILSIVIETIQMSDYIYGTFDYMDIIIEILLIFLASQFIKKQIKEATHNEN